MTLLRAAYRTMLASYFISSGVKAVRNPAPLAPMAQPLAERFVPVVKRYAPDEVAGYVPEDPQTLVRLNGAVQIVGGLALATGKGRRIGALLLAGSLVPSTLAKYPFWSQTGEEKAASRSHFAKNVSILGGVLLASRDTEGKPGIAWRAQAGSQAIAKTTSRATKKLTHSGTGDRLAKQASLVGSAVTEAAGGVAERTTDLAEAAVAGGAALLGAAALKTRGTRKQARKQFKQAQVRALKQAKATRERLAVQAKEAQKQAAKRAEENRVAAAKAAKQAKKDDQKRDKQRSKLREQQLAQRDKQSAKLDKEAAKLEKEAAKVAKRAAKRNDRSVDKVGLHIELGEN